VQSVAKKWHENHSEILLVEAEGGRSTREAPAALLQLGGDRCGAAEDDTDGLAVRASEYVKLGGVVAGIGNQGLEAL
jgi:hypothetical protein